MLAAPTAVFCEQEWEALRGHSDKHSDEPALFSVLVVLIGPSTREASTMSRIRVEQTPLPGIGVRHDLLTEEGRRIGVVSHRSGLRDLVVFDPEDPDGASDCLSLTDEEADALADILDASRVMSRLSTFTEEIAGLVTEQVPLDADAPYVNRQLGDTGMRTRTGASIVAVMRGQQAIASPGPEFSFQPGDVVLLVGTRRGADKAAAILLGREY